MPSNNDAVVLNWGVSLNVRNPQGSADRAPFELYSVYPPMRLEIWGLNISDASNWAYPYRLKVEGGYVCVTRPEVEKIIAEYLRLTKVEEVKDV